MSLQLIVALTKNNRIPWAFVCVGASSFNGFDFLLQTITSFWIFDVLFNEFSVWVSTCFETIITRIMMCWFNDSHALTMFLTQDQFTFARKPETNIFYCCNLAVKNIFTSIPFKTMILGNLKYCMRPKKSRVCFYKRDVKTWKSR